MGLQSLTYSSTLLKKPIFFGKRRTKDRYANEPMNGIVLIHDDDTDIAERCLHYFGFDLRSNNLESGWFII